MRPRMAISIRLFASQVYFFRLKQMLIGPKGTTVKENSADGGPKRPVVILQHGLMDSCAGWILNGQQSLAYILADLNYDVWMNNSRGNRYSRHHIFLDADDDKHAERFWDYSFEEMAKYD
jgi:pimeloyl-ACP methyl ester carboxylesterase